MPGPPPRRVFVLQVAGGNWHVGQRRLVWLVFDGRRPAPIVACKCSLSAADGPLAAEYHALESLAALRGRLAFAVPEPLELQRDATCTLLVQRCLPGQPLHGVQLRATYPSEAAAIERGLRLAVRLCCSLNQRAEPPRRVPAGDHPAVHRLLTMLDEVARLGGLDRWSSLTARGLESALDGTLLPHPWCGHGDLTSDHIVIHRRTWGVIDWEGYTSDALPFSDLTHYCLTLKHYFHVADSRTVSAAFYEPQSRRAAPLGEPVQRALTQLQTVLRVDPDEARVWLALSVLESALAAQRAVIKAGAREPEWDDVMQSTLRVLGLTPGPVSADA